MGKVEIKSESLPYRCEICHKTDSFEPVLNYCSRCENISNGKRNQKIVGKKPTKKHTTVVISLFVGSIVGICVVFLCNFPTTIIPLEYKKRLFEHPLSFQLTYVACGLEAFYGYKSSDGETLTYATTFAQTPESAKRKLDNYLKTTYQILEEKQVTNPNDGKTDFRIVATFKAKEQNNARVLVMTVRNTNTTIIDAPSLFHIQEFEYYFSHK